MKKHFSSPTIAPTKTAMPSQAFVEQPSPRSRETHLDLNYGALLCVVFGTVAIIAAFLALLVFLRQPAEIKAVQGGKVNYSTNTEVSAKVPVLSGKGGEE